MNNILVTTSSFGIYDPSVKDSLQNAGLNPIYNPFGRKLTENEILSLVTQHNPVAILAGVEPLTRNVLSSSRNLKTVARCGIGMDSVDQDAARDLGISVSNTPDGPSRAVAELVVGALLSLLRGIHRTDSSIRKGEWVRPFGELLHGKTVGILGCGRIGCLVGELCTAFGCKVIGCDPVSCLEHGDMVEAADLVAQCDILTLHLPYTKQNHHLVDAAMIERMRPGSIIVNTSRGGLVDETALAKGLESGRLGGAVLDTFEDEPYAGPLKRLDNVVLTAHIGSYARECRIEMERESVSNLLRDLEQAV